jgi:hypothetical protein
MNAILEFTAISETPAVLASPPPTNRHCATASASQAEWIAKPAGAATTLERRDRISLVVSEVSESVRREANLPTAVRF